MSPAGLYVHVPFCARACPYCDFDFEVGRAPRLEPYFAGLERELELRRAEIGEVSGSGGFGTLYVGGGTPSLLGPAGIARLADSLGRHLVVGTTERTIELNPEHVDGALVEAIVAAGFDRVSLGVQTFEPDGLAQLGRVHAPDDARRAIGRLGAAGLSISVDLIVGWPGQRGSQLDADVAEADALGVDHVSVYALTIEAGAPWTKLVRRGLRVLPDDDAAADRLLEAESALEALGFSHYEVASYGRRGARALHNQLYWTWVDYVGLGPSAASARFFPDGSVLRRSNQRGLAAWSRDPGAAGELERLEPEAAAREGLWTALRRLEGLDPARFVARFGRHPSWLDAVVAPCLADGSLEFVGSGPTRRLAVAPGRWLWHDSIATQILGG